MSSAFRNATIVSLEESRVESRHHLEAIELLQIDNNAVCWTLKDEVTWARATKYHKSQIFPKLVEKIYTSPELFRFQYISDILDTFSHFDARTLFQEWGKFLGQLFSSALTSVVIIPSQRNIAKMMSILYGRDSMISSQALMFNNYPSEPYVCLENLFNWKSNVNQECIPQVDDVNLAWVSIDFNKILLFDFVLRSSWNFTLQSRYLKSDNDFTFLRFDVVNLTRYVHHHFDYARDGHSRTYTMKISRNESLKTWVVYSLKQQQISYASYSFDSSGTMLSVGNHSIRLPPGFHALEHQLIGIFLVRDSDHHMIPYSLLSGVTLISVLRLGLDSSKKKKLYNAFLDLPIYEDMAPWNLVLSGNKLSYIDYDTKGITYDDHISLIYQMTVALMNFKRTVEDFHECGKKVHTIYGLPFVSECVGSTTKKRYDHLFSIFSYLKKASSPHSLHELKCHRLSHAVPCADGLCHATYISCLKVITNVNLLLSIFYLTANAVA
jgi:hypothetical protein